MNQLNRLPMAAKIGIAGGIAAVILAVAFMFMSGGEKYEVVKQSTDARQLDAWAWKLNQEEMKYEKVGNELRVRTSDKDRANDLLNGSDLESRLKDKKSSCEAPGTLDGTAARKANEDCKKAHEIAQRLEDKQGILAAKVTLSKNDPESFVDNETTNVAVGLFLESGAQLDGAQLAEEIALMAGNNATPQSVIISDDTGEPLWSPKMASEMTGTSSGCVVNPELELSVTEQQGVVESCIEEELRAKIGEMVGGEERVYVAAGATLSAAARTQQIKKFVKGAIASQSKTESGSDTTWTPSENMTTLTADSGIIQRLSIAVVLDARFVKPSLEPAVRQLALTKWNPKRGDPQPKVISGELPTAAAPTKEETEAANAPTSPVNSGATTNAVPDTGVSGALLAAVLVALVGMVTVIALLWRKSSRLAEERRRFELEFQNDQQLFQNYANSNPDEMARELEALLGSPAQPARR
jgi:flagellar biosynthesis/type III secretory pathway M-ring protein FliF/YscJ